MVPIRFRAPLENRLSTTRSAWNEPGPVKLIRPTSAVTTNALACNTSTLRAQAWACRVYDLIQQGKRVSIEYHRQSSEGYPMKVD